VLEWDFRNDGHTASPGAVGRLEAFLEMLR
jgi:hypothetical protein